MWQLSNKDTSGDSPTTQRGILFLIVFRDLQMHRSTYCKLRLGTPSFARYASVVLFLENKTELNPGTAVT